MVIQRGLQLVIRHGKCHIAECLVGDEKRIIIFTARNEQGKFNVLAVYKYNHIGIFACALSVSLFIKSFTCSQSASCLLKVLTAESGFRFMKYRIRMPFDSV